MRRLRYVLAAVLLAFVAGCATFQAYEGAARSSEQLAIIEGSAKFRSEVPLALVIRSVDGREVDLRYASVALLPGKHVLIVDCQVGGTEGNTSRHAVDIDVPAGSRYRLEAEMAPGNRACAGVDLVPR